MVTAILFYFAEDNDNDAYIKDNNFIKFIKLLSGESLSIAFNKNQNITKPVMAKILNIIK